MGSDARRSGRVRRGRKDEDSDDAEMNAALQLTRLDSGVSDQNKEAERLAKIQEKNRKAQQKFRERRKEKMQEMEHELALLHDQVKNLQQENAQLQQKLLVEQQIVADMRSKSSKGSSSRLDGVAEGLQDYDPIDMSFLPQWQGLSLSNEKIRTMPLDTLEQLISTILLDQRTRMMQMLDDTQPDRSAGVVKAIESAFAFLNRCYLIEPVRYREIICGMMGSRSAGGPAGGRAGQTRAAIPLTPEQEAAISAALAQFDNVVDAVWQGREEVCRDLLASRCRRGSELEHMQTFLTVTGCVEVLQESLRRENKGLVTFLTEVGRILGPPQLTLAMSSSGGQDIFTFCQAIRCRALMLDAAAPPAAAVKAEAAAPAPPADCVPPDIVRSGSGFGAPGLFRTAQDSMPLQDNFMLPKFSDPPELDLALPSGRSERGQGGGLVGCKRPLSPGPPLQQHQRHEHRTVNHESPFLYGPGGAGNGGGMASQPVSLAATTRIEFRPPKVARMGGLDDGLSPSVLAPRDSVLELFKSVGDMNRSGSLRLSAGLGALLGESTPSQLPSPTPAATVSLPIAIKGGGAAAGTLVSAATSQAVGARDFVSLFTRQHPGGAERPSGLDDGSHQPAGGSNNGTNLGVFLTSKEGSRTLETLAGHVTTNRTLSAAELLTLPHIEVSAHAGSALMSAVQHRSTAPLLTGMPLTSSAQMISTGSRQPLNQGAAQVTSGQEI